MYIGYEGGPLILQVSVVARPLTTVWSPFIWLFRIMRIPHKMPQAFRLRNSNLPIQKIASISWFQIRYSKSKVVQRKNVFKNSLPIYHNASGIKSLPTFGYQIFDPQM